MSVIEIAVAGNDAVLVVTFLAGILLGIKAIIWLDARYRKPARIKSDYQHDGKQRNRR